MNKIILSFLLTISILSSTKSIAQDNDAQAIFMMSEINKAMLQLDHVKGVLSNAGRTHCVMGKQVKPQLMQNLDDLVAKAQPRLSCP